MHGLACQELDFPCQKRPLSPKKNPENESALKTPHTEYTFLCYRLLPFSTQHMVRIIFK